VKRTTTKTKPARKREPVKSPDAAIDPPPDPEGVAAELLGEPAPNGDGDGAPKSAAERMRAYRRRKKGEPEAEPVQVPALNPNESAALIAVLWATAVVPLAGKHRDGTPRLNDLDEAQAMRMGEVYAPLLTKWAPILGAWQLEVTALIVTVTVIRECANARPASTMPTPQREFVEAKADADLSPAASGS
jgi:hypothetical protein